MPLEAKESESDSRLSSSEIEALRSWLGPDAGARGDLRAQGIPTVSDFAESFGVRVADVQAQLERLRAEKAFAATQKKPNSQRGLAMLAAALFISAAVIYKVTPHKMTDAEMDALVQEIKERSRNRPKPITYPIVNKIDVGNDAMPPGFNVEFVGNLTKTMVVSDVKVQALSRQETQARLQRILAEVFPKAEAFEEAAPKPKTPPPPPKFGAIQTPAPGQYYVQVGNGQMWLDFPDSPGESSATREARIADQFRRIAESTVDGIWNNQLALLGLPRTDGVKTPPITDGFGRKFINPPPGFVVSFKGRTQTSTGRPEAILLPIDPQAVAARLAELLRNMIRQDNQPFPFETDSMRAERAKIPIPKSAEFKITGPLRDFSVSVPLKPSDGFPTAADVAREADRRIEEAGREAERQARELNRRGQK